MRKTIQAIYGSWAGSLLAAGRTDDEVRDILESSIPGINMANEPEACAAAHRARETILLKLPEIREKFAIQRFEVVGDTPEQFAASIRRDHARYGEIIRKAGIKID